MPTNTQLIKEIGAGLVRHGLTYGAGFLIGAGVLSSSQESDFVGAGMLLAGIAWSAYQKWAKGGK